MFVRDAYEVVAPGVHIGVLERDGIKTSRFKERVHGLGLSVHVELFFEQFVDRDIEVKGWKARALRAELVVEVEAARAFKEEIYFGARETPLCAAVVPILMAIWIIPAYEFRHACSIPLRALGARKNARKGHFFVRNAMLTEQ